jgi:hypothetical protein
MRARVIGSHFEGRRMGCTHPIAEPLANNGILTTKEGLHENAQPIALISN